MKSKEKRVLLAACAGALFFSAAGAGAWEFAYGPPNSVDSAFRRVLPAKCPVVGPGYLAVGTMSPNGGNPDVYVVYTSLAGWPIWEMTYDVGSQGLVDEGVAVISDPNSGGFVILSNTLAGAWSTALTAIDCSGKVQWSQIYVDTPNGFDLRGRDLIRAANGDYVVAGVSFNGNDDDALLMYVKVGGTLSWSRAYDPGGNEAFHALTEAAPLPGQLVGDLVAVGRFTKFGQDDQGLVARVSGAGGALGGPPHCMVNHGGSPSNEVYESVVQLTTPGYAGDFVMAGSSDFSGTADIWLMRGDPCVPAAGSLIGDPGVATFELAYDLREVSTGAGAPIGSLAVAGTHLLAGFPGLEGALIFADPGTLMPIGGSGRVFGDFGSGSEIFFSLNEIPASWPLGGYVLAGLTTTDWAGLGDPQDLYLVHYDPGAPGCEGSWSPSGTPLGWLYGNLGPVLRSPAKEVPVNTAEKPQSDPFQICP